MKFASLIATFEIAILLSVHLTTFVSATPETPNVHVLSCAECGIDEAGHQSWTIAIAQKVNGGTQFQYATAIGKKTALSTGRKHWDVTKVHEYRVHLMMKDGKIAQQNVNSYCELIDIKQKKIGLSSADVVVLLTLSKDLPNAVTPACLPTTAMILKSTSSMAFNFPFYSRRIRPEETITVTFIHKQLKEVGKTHFYGKLIQLERSNERGRMIATGAAVTYVKDNRQVMRGVAKSTRLKFNDSYESVPCCLPIDSTEVLNWIDKTAGKDNVCKAAAETASTKQNRLQLAKNWAKSVFIAPLRRKKTN